MIIIKIRKKCWVCLFTEKKKSYKKEKKKQTLEYRRNGGFNIVHDNSQSLSLFNRTSSLSWFLYSITLKGDSLTSSQVNDDDDDDNLRSRIFRLKPTKRSVTNVIQRWLSEGNQISISDLRHISKDLKKSHRYKHTLEVCFFLSL